MGRVSRELLRFPTAKTSVACLCNLGTANPSALADGVADVVLAARLQPKPRLALPRRAGGRGFSRAARELAGYYENAAAGAFRRLVVRDGVLVVMGQRLKPVAQDRFVPSAREWSSSFQRQLGRASGDAHHQGRPRPEIHRRVATPVGVNVASSRGRSPRTNWRRLDPRGPGRASDGGRANDPPSVLTP